MTPSRLTSSVELFQPAREGAFFPWWRDQPAAAESGGNFGADARQAGDQHCALDCDRKQDRLYAADHDDRILAVPDEAFPGPGGVLAAE